MGTTLYHGSKRIKQFDPSVIDIGESDLTAFFSPNKNFASSYIQDCVMSPEESGYIHEFTTTANINNIYMLSPYAKEFSWNLKTIGNKFCKTTKYGSLNGIGFYVSPNKTSPTSETSEIDLNMCEFALCDSTQYLKYIGTYTCQGHRQLSDKYKFTAGTVRL